MTLEILTSDNLLPVKHGFFTRRGGASSGVFQGLNCGLGSSDQDEIVQINRARVSDAMGVDPGRLVTAHQTHSSVAVTLDAKPEEQPQADGLVTNKPDVLLAILTADCAPVLFADPVNGTVGAAHAGWRGALNGVLEATLDAMITLGAQRENVVATVGPTISQRAYEVGPEFFDTFMAEDHENSRFFANGQGDRMQFDLPSYVLTRLRSAGVAEAEWTGHCTYSEPDRFFSYRRATHAKEADYGRLISTIRL